MQGTALIQRVIFSASEFSSAFAAITSASSYPSQPASPPTLRRTISDNLAVAVSFNRSTVLRSGVGNPDSGLDCREVCGRVLNSRALVYDL